MENDFGFNALVVVLGQSLVVISYSPDFTPSYPLAVLDIQMTRAQKLKMHFYGSEAIDAQVQIETFRYLAQHSSQWEELALGMTAAMVPLVTALRDHLPSLRRLSIQWEARS
ncbi:hypothetical protein C8R43DRAFT_1129572 [Mycena crocata]|nr:hypothetical protein C8R43DRAFT_1129572 [Mycena crocata]